LGVPMQTLHAAATLCACILVPFFLWVTEAGMGCRGGATKTKKGSWHHRAPPTTHHPPPPPPAWGRPSCQNWEGEMASAIRSAFSLTPESRAGSPRWRSRSPMNCCRPCCSGPSFLSSRPGPGLRNRTTRRPSRNSRARQIQNFIHVSMPNGNKTYRAWETLNVALWGFANRHVRAKHSLPISANLAAWDGGEPCKRRCFFSSMARRRCTLCGLARPRRSPPISADGPSTISNDRFSRPGRAGRTCGVSLAVRFGPRLPYYLGL